MIKEFKDWLFVKVPEDATEFMISCAQSDNDLLHKNENGYNYIASFGTTMNQYQIIGKGDGLSDKDWKEIVERIHENGPLLWKNYTYPVGPRFWWDAPTLSGHSLLRSLGMEPGTTLVLKKL